MAPEMAVGYVIGVIPSLAATAVHFWFHKKKLKSSAFQQLQTNLASIHKFWSESQSRILALEDGSSEQDQEAFKKSLAIMGTLFAFLSWMGFIFNIIVLWSVHSLAVTRLEQKVFASDLCKRTLSASEVQALVAEIEA
ncbi:MAG: hypothetical protein J7501_16140 [Bdellovibrio sp.]|nr:hypothetical protein [Bdellovibrio sp.]